MLRDNAPVMYLEAEFWTDGKWHGACYRHKPLPGSSSDIPRYVLHVTTDAGYDDPRDAIKDIKRAFPDLPSPLDGMTDAEIAAGIEEAKRSLMA